MCHTISDLKREGCKSLTALMRGNRHAQEGFEVFFAQTYECVFFMGACHVLAAAMYKLLRSEGLDVAVFKILDENQTTWHFVVGQENGPYVDANLKWQAVEEIRVFWQHDTLQVSDGILLDDRSPLEFQIATAGGVCDGIPKYCTAPKFITTGRDRAKSFLAANTAKIEILLNSPRNRKSC